MKYLFWQAAAWAESSNNSQIKLPEAIFIMNKFIMENKNKAKSVIYSTSCLQFSDI